jgi:aspartate/glutamate racemase
MPASILSAALCVAAGATSGVPSTASGDSDYQQVLRGQASTIDHSASKPRQPVRNWNPMCLGIIGGVGPQAGADVFSKAVDTSSQKPWYYQARDAPMIMVNSSPKLDGTTQNNWVWGTQAEQVSNIGEVLEEIANSFPSCVHDYGAFGLACNTIHDYLYDKLNEYPGFVSIIGAVHKAFKRESKPGSPIFVLGSAVTMSDVGEYKVLWGDSKNDWKINQGIPASERGWLWDHVILEVQKDNKQLAHENLKAFLIKYVKDKSTPISLSCTELPIAAKDANGKFIEGYKFIDPNEELAKAVVERGEERLKEMEPEKYAGWKSGVEQYEKKCCEATNANLFGIPKSCSLCCEGKDCA